MANQRIRERRVNALAMAEGQLEIGIKKITLKGAKNKFDAQQKADVIFSERGVDNSQEPTLNKKFNCWYIEVPYTGKERLAKERVINNLKSKLY